MALKLLKSNKLKTNWKLLKLRALSYKHSFELRSIQNNTHSIKPSDIIVFSTLRNEAFRVEHFLSYYRQLGVNHFIFVDNDSDDNFSDVVLGQTDCSVWHTKGSYKKANFGMHWLNFLLSKYGSGHWCLTVDPDELLVFPHSEHRNLHELTNYLSQDRRESMFCLMLDMYGENSIENTHCRAGQNPLEVSPYFDPDDYIQRYNVHNWDVFIQGGPRLRVIFKDEPNKAPALNKVPLIRWQKSYKYVSSMHHALPKRLNRPYTGNKLSPTGCLLHFKFLSSLKEKATEEIHRGEHYDNSREYKIYKDFISSNANILKYSGSRKYVSSEDLINLGLMNTGRWF